MRGENSKLFHICALVCKGLQRRISPAAGSGSAGNLCPSSDNSIGARIHLTIGSGSLLHPSEGLHSLSGGRLGRSSAARRHPREELYKLII